MNAQVDGFLIEQQVNIDFTFQVVSGEIGIFVRPFAVMNPVKNVELVPGFDVILLRDFVSVNRAVIAGCPPAAAASS